MRVLSSAQPGAARSACRRTALRRQPAPLRASVSSSGGEGDGRPHVAVIGAGWGGWGAAKALAEAGVRVTVLDAARDPTGATPFTTPSGKPFEAGTRGFWKVRAGRGLRVERDGTQHAAPREQRHGPSTTGPRNWHSAQLGGSTAARTLLHSARASRRKTQP